ncbi:MAG: TolC family protein, partial [Acidobacteriota bacterium]
GPRQIQETGVAPNAGAELNTTLGGAVDAACDIGGELKERRFPIPSQGQLLGEALQNRPDYRQTEMEMARRQQQIRSARGAYLPDLNLFAQFGHSGQDLNSGSADFTVGASVTFNVLDRGRTARARRAHASWEAARALREERAGQIRLEVVRAYQNFLAAEESLRVASGVIDQAQETLRIVRDRNRVGLTTITEVLRAQTAVVRAQMNLLEARYNYYLGYARSLLVSGQLTSVSSLA